jgi:hypothetical protein
MAGGGFCSCSLVGSIPLLALFLFRGDFFR